MEVKPRRKDIVIIASAHNPSIIAPQWLKDNSLILEEPIHFVHTPDFSLFESESFSLLVDHQRLQITAKKQDDATLNSLADLAAKYVDLLPHIPYQSLGLNFTWSVEMAEGETLPKIEVNINGTDLLSVFEDHDVHYGGIIYARSAIYVLKLVIESQEKNSLINNFNFHHELKGRSLEDIRQFIGNFSTRYDDSLRILKNLYSLGEKE
ncbi:MAG: hypothetical protein IBX41_01350 [Methanophagales archaeon]|nr:hypothetical protein [Methanophagales archaeon]